MSNTITATVNDWGVEPGPLEVRLTTAPGFTDDSSRVLLEVQGEDGDYQPAEDETVPGPELTLDDLREVGEWQRTITTQCRDGVEQFVAKHRAEVQ